MKAKVGFLIFMLLMLGSGNVWALDLTSTGFYYPTGTSNPGSYAGWMCSGCNGNGCYFAGEYHIGQDVSAEFGDPAYLIADGVVEYISLNGWGSGNKGVFVRHRLSDGTDFLALYGHIVTNASVGQLFFAGEVIGTIGHWNSGDHLHFGVLPDVILPTGSFGRMSCSSWPSPNGFVDPMDWIESRSPKNRGVGLFTDGWHDGVTGDFRAKYREIVTGVVSNPSDGHDLGNARDADGPADENVHLQNDMYIQDYYGFDNDFVHPYTALIRKTGTNQGVFLLKEGFWDYWMNNHGWLLYGAPTSDEDQNHPNHRQNFSNSQGYYFLWSWEQNRTRVFSADDNQEINLACVVVQSSFASLTEGDGVYHSGVKVANFGESFSLVNGDSYSGFSARIGGNNQTIAQFTVNGDMTIQVGGGLASQVTNLSATTYNPCPGDPFNVSVSVSASPGVVVDWLRVGLMRPSEPIPANIIYSEPNRSLSPGFSGTFSTQYLTPGNYQIAVQYSMDDGNTWNYFGTYPNIQNPLPIAILAPPMGNIGYSQSSGYAPLAVQFFDQTSGYHDYIRWEFGDGQLSNLPNPIHVYNFPGSYSVSLIVSNGCGSDVESCWDCIVVSQAGEGPNASFTADVTSGPTPLWIQFTDLSTGSPDINYWFWDFGDGNTSTFPSPSHVYNAPGVYNVSLLVSNSLHSDYLFRPNFVSVGYPVLVPDFSADTTVGIEALTVQFVDQSTGYPQSRIWGFGDGQTSTELNPIHTYSDPGPYTVILQLTDSYRMVEKVRSHYITILQQITASFSADTVSGTSPLTVQFTDQSTGNPFTRQWDFGDGAISSDRNPIHTYYMPGGYDVKLIVADDYQSDTLIFEDYVSVVSPEPLAVNFTANVTGGYAPLTVQFTDQSTGSPTYWEWDFDGDNSPDSYEQNPQFVYVESGIYPVALTIGNGHSTRFTIRHDYIFVDSDCNQNGLSDLGEMQIGYPPASAINAEPGVSSFVYPVDFDFDGDLDVVSAGWSDGNIIWHENSGNQAFVSHQIGFQDRARFVYAVDLDSDGDLDVLTHSTNMNPGIYWYENTEFVFTVHPVSSQAVPDVYPVDLDQDGDTDVLAPFGDTSSGVCWYANLGNGNFAEQSINARTAKSTYPYDTDVDGDLDVLAIGQEGVYLYENDGSQNFSEIFITDLGSDGNYVRVIDVIGYGDDYFDIVFPQSNQIRWIENHGSNVFGNQDILVSGVIRSNYICPADIDGDGDTDFFSADMYGNRVSWFENLGPSEAFVEHLLDSLAYEAACINSADMDGDGDLDAVAGMKNVHSIFWYDVIVRDRNHTGKLDECEIASGLLVDCNDNNIPDQTEINMGTAKDENENEVLDECEPLVGTMDLTIRYQNGNVVLDWLDLAGAARYEVHGSSNNGPYQIIGHTGASAYTMSQALFATGDLWQFFIEAAR